MQSNIETPHRYFAQVLLTLPPDSKSSIRSSKADDCTCQANNSLKECSQAMHAAAVIECILQSRFAVKPSGFQIQQNKNCVRPLDMDLSQYNICASIYMYIYIGILNEQQVRILPRRPSLLLRQCEAMAESIRDQTWCEPQCQPMDKEKKRQAAGREMKSKKTCVRRPRK